MVLSQTSLNKRTGHAADEQAHFYLRDYDEHGRGSPANFLYFARPLVYRAGYLPTTVSAGSLYAEQSAIVVFKLHADPARKYQDLLDRQKALANPLEGQMYFRNWRRRGHGLCSLARLFKAAHGNSIRQALRMVKR